MRRLSTLTYVRLSDQSAKYAYAADMLYWALFRTRDHFSSEDFIMGLEATVVWLVTYICTILLCKIS